MVNPSTADDGMCTQYATFAACFVNSFQSAEKSVCWSESSEHCKLANE